MGLLDFLQSASNAAASNVTAPVDGIAWLLRKAGIDVGEPMGGSDWAKRQGMMRDVPQSAASLGGETLGLLSPMLAAAKAPQIARGLLQGAENLAKPATLNPQLGATVWHGSPHKFDKFDSTKIGTGEGAQAYGHGLYLAESPDVAGHYQALALRNGEVAPNPLAMWTRRLEDAGSSKVEAERLAVALSNNSRKNEVLSFDPVAAARNIRAERSANRNPDTYDLRAPLGQQMGVTKEEAHSAFNALREAAVVTDGGRLSNLYKVDLPDEHIARMLDWDKPLSQQAPGVQKALESLGYKYDAQAMRSFTDELAAALEGTGPATLSKMPRDPMGSDIARGGGLFDGPAQVAKAKALREAGIPGLRYLDGGSRAGGAGTSNYVVFPGNEDLLKILERNGIPVR